MRTIITLDKVSFDTLYATFGEAFKDYEIHLNRQELTVMLKRRGFSPELSFGALEDENLVSFTLNGIGIFNGEKTAYDTGTGTIEQYRGKGIASEIFTASIPYLKDAGVKQYLLEVLQHNTKAVSVYKKLSFAVSREFNYYRQVNANVILADKKLHERYSVKETSLDKLDGAMDFWDFSPSWQNSFEAVNRCASDFKIIGTFIGSQLTGYCIFEPVSGDITQIAVDRAYRRQGIATALLKEMVKRNKHTMIKAVNIETTCEAMGYFLESCGIPLKGRQFEMIKKLSSDI
jgi:ribosomal protein S18 acetylase RimI-like enzyme